MLGDHPSAQIVDRAVQAAHELSGVDTCSATGVHVEIPMPVDAALVAQITALEHEAATLSGSLSLLTKTDVVIDHARSIVERARALNYPPLTARAARMLARLGMYTTDHATIVRRPRCGRISCHLRRTRKAIQPPRCS